MIKGASINSPKLGYVMLQNADGGATVEESSLKSCNDASGPLFRLVLVAGAKPELNKLAVLLWIYQESQAQLIGAGLSAPRRLVLSQGWFGRSHDLLVGVWFGSSSYFVSSAVHLNGIWPSRPKRFFPTIHCASVGACLSGLYIQGR